MPLFPSEIRSKKLLDRIRTWVQEKYQNVWCALLVLGVLATKNRETTKRRR